MKCATDKNVETELTCGNCGTPICPRCLVMTPSGQRCRACARLRRPPMYQLGPLIIARGAGAAVAVGVAAGVVWSFLPAFLGLFVFLLAVGLGYAMAAAVGRATNRKRGYALQLVAAFGVVLAYVVRNLILGGVLLPLGDLFGYIAVAIAIFVAVSPLR